MARPFICGGEKYNISDTNTIGLVVSLNDLPEEIVIEGTRLKLKSDFHVSLVCINEIIKKHNVLIPGFKDGVREDFCDFVSTNNVELVNYRDEFKFVEQDDMKSVVVMCNVSNLDKFFDFFCKKYGLNIEYPPTHVTLYVTKVGIFLTDAEDIKKLTKSIPNPMGHPL